MYYFVLLSSAETHRALPAARLQLLFLGRAPQPRHHHPFLPVTATLEVQNLICVYPYPKQTSTKTYSYLYRYLEVVVGIIE